MVHILEYYGAYFRVLCAYFRVLCAYFRVLRAYFRVLCCAYFSVNSWEIIQINYQELHIDPGR